MYKAKRPSLRPFILLLILATLLLTGCGASFSNSNWPGLSTDGTRLYLAYGPRVAAYDADTQELVWAFPAEANQSLQFFAAPSIEDGRVVFGDYGLPGGFFSPSVTVSVYAVENVDSGIPPELWVNNEVASDKIVAPPLQVGGVVYVGTADNFVYALDAETGAGIWEFGTGHSIWGQPAYANGVLLVASMDHSLYALDAETGDLLWSTQLTGALPSAPVLNDNLVYVSNFDNQMHALDISTGEEVWAAGASNWVWGAPTYADGVVYYADVEGNLFAVDAATGELIWQQETAGAVQTSPVVVGDVIYVASEGASADVPVGALTAFAVEDGRELWQKVTPAPLFTTPVVVNDQVVVALQSEEALLIGFNQETGEQLWTVAPPEA